MRFSSRFFLYGPFLMFVALAFGVMTYWWFAAAALSHRLDALNGREIAPGVDMHFASKRIAGFPFRLDVVFADFTLRSQGAHGPISWHTAHLASHALTYSHDVTLYEAQGVQDLNWIGESGTRHSFRFTPGALRASLMTEAGKFARFDIDVISLAASDFASGRAQFHMRRDPASDAFDLVADLQSVRFAGDIAAGFAQGLTHARIEGRLAPAAAFAPALAGRTNWRQALDNWRAARGTFKIDQAAAFWGKCEATSSGAATLDAAHRLSGSLAFTLTDCDALAKEAASATAHPRAHRALLAVLADLAAREPVDRGDSFPVTIVFKDGLIYVGPGKSLGANSFFEPVGFLHAVY